MEHPSSFQGQLPKRLKARVVSTTLLAPDILGFDLRPAEGGALPPFTAGAHIDLHLPTGASRSYSLVNPQDETHRYEIAVKRESPGKGGSAFLHDVLRTGAIVEIGSPRNNFMLEENAPYSVLFAGGIGVTPVVSMAQRLKALGRPFALHYGARSRTEAAFTERLAQAHRKKVHFWFDDELDGRRMDIRGIAESAPEHAHFYCCGPAPMIAAFEDALKHLPPTRVHREHFSGTVEPGVQGGFEVVLARSGRTIRVPGGETILGALLGEGVEVDFSCMEGFCGSCKVGIVEGTPIHRDTVLSPSERTAGKVMLVCCSTTAGERLVLDL